MIIVLRQQSVGLGKGRAVRYDFSVSKDDLEVEPPAYLNVLFVAFLGLALFGYLYNISKLSTSSIFTVFFFDVLVVSYTNLLAIPLLALVTFTKFEKKIVFPRRDVWSLFFIAPFGYIAIVFLFRILERLW